MNEKPKQEVNELEESLLKLTKKHSNKNVLNDLLKKYQPVDIAKELNHFEEEKDVLKVLNLANNDLKASIFIELKFELQTYIIKNLSNNALKPLVKSIYSDDLVEIIDEMPTKIVEKILTAATPQKRQELNYILKNEEESAGAKMAVDFIRFDQHLTIAQARAIILKDHLNVESVDDLYVIDEYGTLLGEIQLKDLVVNQSQKKLSNIMQTNFVSVQEKADQEEIVELFKKYDLTTLPVVNVENKIIGIITSEDVIDVMEQEQNEDLDKFVGISPLDDDVFKTSVWKIFLSRIGWLVGGLLFATIIQILLVVFLNAYKVNDIVNEPGSLAFIAVYLLVPMSIVLILITSIASNQTTSSFIRLLSLNRYDHKEIFKMVGKEFFVNFLNLIIILAFNILRLVIFYEAQLNDVKSNYLWKTIGVSSLAITVGILVGTIMGTFLPILLKKLKWDPSTISSPLITITNGIVTTAVFFGIGLLVF